MSSVSITATSTEPGFEIHDTIEGRSVTFETAEAVDPECTDEDRFLYPTDATATIETSALRLGTMVSIFVRTPSGEMVDRIRSHQRRELSDGIYHVEISSTVKVYFRVEGPITFDAGADHLDIDFDTSRRVDIGARSYHQHPAGTIQTTMDPGDLMTAIEAFSSSMKTTRPEMSYPTLRGHPPLLEIGEDLEIPDDLESPETGITIEVPPQPRMIYPVASLAYYLGAEISRGEPPRIVTEDGFDYPLVTERWFEDEVAQVLKQVLLLDSVVRTKGFYGNDLYERTLVEPHLQTDLETLYDLPLTERLQEYLTVDFEAVREAVPRWVMTAYVPPTPAGAETLPHLVNELAIIRNPRGTRVDRSEAKDNLGVSTETGSSFLNDGNRVRLLIKPELFDDSVEHVWFGDHVPIGATKGTIEAFEAKLDRPAKGPQLTIAVVSNDPGLVQEPDVLEETYRGRGDLDYEIDTFVGTTTEELRNILGTSYDFLHYIGETSSTGLHASDGTVDGSDLAEVATEAFLIDADHSFEEALSLAHHGALGGVGTVGTVDRDSALQVGRAIARLLNVGFSIRGALDVIREQVAVGNQYVVVGDGSVDIAQPESAFPTIIDIQSKESRGFSVALETYPAGIFRVGSTVSPHFRNAGMDFLAPGTMGVRYTMTRSELNEVAGWDFSPLRIDGSLYWNNTVQNSTLLKD
ncbi:Uncharacterized protein HSRCO_2621 [Halanaeroarchaeum sp. HSR-CO]|uniref:hypothetical protein n=1 Tax=Halanaeroarchaeum sp. HSR-CO TaxID=2866382 RepID=UPI00217E2561|nr:hypothetical protein [Halanaeroarchaeum sp. HSR-CO]UWG48881.1 Uncharacterized protein HSRCO_2621 [Halanaeroarchaeum sp. HSR-CO]